MTGQLDLNTPIKKFWPKLTTAQAEGVQPEAYGGGSDGAPLRLATAPADPVTLAETSYEPASKLWTGQITGGIPAYTVDWGDGSNTSLVLVAGPITHTYADAPGSFTVGVTDAEGAAATLPVTLT